MKHSILEQTILQMQRAMEHKEISARELAIEYLSRIATHDCGPAGLSSMAEINPEALFIADTLDHMRAEGRVLGPLHGIPITLKDNIDTADKMSTSSGSQALACNFAREDAFVVKKLRDAGAVILGKTCLSEFAHFLTGESPHGHSSRGGQVRNPYNPAGETPGGSSSGSGAAVAARLCAASVGSDTCGSIMGPTALNGLAGMRPTKGLISCNGVIPISTTMDTTGPMARSVTDMALMLGIMAGRDEQDATTYLSPLSCDYMEALNGTLRGKRIGVNRCGYPEKMPEEQQAFEALLRLLEENGATLVHGTDFDIEYQPPYDIMECEFKQSLDCYLSRCQTATPRTMADILAYNQANPKRMLQYGQARMLKCHNETTGTLTDVAYLSALLRREAEIHRLNILYETERLDVVVSPKFTAVTAFTGFPSMSIPIGQRADAVPIGACWMARRYDEAKLIEVTAAVESLLGLALAPNL